MWPMYVIDETDSVLDAGERECGPLPSLLPSSSAVHNPQLSRGVQLPAHDVHVNFTRTVCAGMMAFGSWSSYWWRLSILEQDTSDDDQGALKIAGTSSGSRYRITGHITMNGALQKAERINSHALQIEGKQIWRRLDQDGDDVPDQ
ncbi:hypothetical protein CPC08DRAFT_722032 [Agrocybe pediades]|nr:hypothetical protein CPC08DRAFT_722032 [Agrocybe pediades]